MFNSALASQQRACTWSGHMAEFLRSGAIVVMGTIVIGASVFVIFYG